MYRIEHDGTQKRDKYLVSVSTVERDFKNGNNHFSAMMNSCITELITYSGK